MHLRKSATGSVPGAKVDRIIYNCIWWWVKGLCVARYFRMLLPPLCVFALVWTALACRETSRTEDTEILLAITSTQWVDVLELLVRNIDYDLAVSRYDLGGRDLTKESYRILLTPPVGEAGQIFVHARGMVNAETAVSKGAILTFARERHLEVALQLTPTIDSDGDGFAACSLAGCDCDDHDAKVNPFTRERCDDNVDNNCSGLPINEGCACTDEAVQPCTPLSAELRHLAGIGRCQLGTVACVDGMWEGECDGGDFVEEIASNFVDDDCDGSVDEGSPCRSGETRPCHRGFVDDDDNPDAAMRDRASDLAKGVCRNPATGLPYGVQRCIEEGGRSTWGTCEGDVLPQRDPVAGFGWLELPPNLAKGDTGQCDGLDNDCDGLYDEDFFDADGDGFTSCGTCPEKDSEPKLCIDSIDCDNGNRNINPSMHEICGNTVDEDCRCDHDPQDRVMGSEGSVIGLPVVDLAGIRACRSQDAYLHCDAQVRSDDTTPGLCADRPQSYYHGYFGPTASDRDCYFCGESFGRDCGAGVCTTKEADCAVCDAADPPDASLLAFARPLCATAGGGCRGLEEPLWEAITESDPNGDCGGFACTGYYAGIVDGRCYEKRAQTAEEVRCRGYAQCETAADLCPGETAAAAEPMALPGICQKVTGGCSETMEPNFAPQDNGEDLFDDCDATYVCNTNDDSNGGGPFYHGVRDPTLNDNLDNPFCYLNAEVSDAACNGQGACQSRAEACALADEGEIAAGRAPCTHVVDANDSCRGTAGPRYAFVEAFADPYGECGDSSCDGNGGCTAQKGSSCGAGSTCDAGFTCVDGVCCNEACDAACMACVGSLTGQPDGFCAPLMVSQGDPGKCGENIGCTGTVTTCICQAGTGQCLHANAAACANDGECASGHCICVGAGCLLKACSSNSCMCGFDANSDGDCDGFVSDGVDDAEHSCGQDLTCDGSGGCNLPVGTVCESHQACETNHCECVDEGCNERKCAEKSCKCGYGIDGSCTQKLGVDAAIEDREDCDGTKACVDGVCVNTDNESCSGNENCVNTCVNSTCASYSGLGEPCDAGDDGDCAGNVACAEETCGGVGAACSDNENCVGSTTCSDNVCGGVGAICSSSSNCVVGDCADKICGGPGASCRNGDNCAFANCENSICGAPGASCQDDGACLYENCMGEICGSNEAMCSENAECVNVCIGSVCHDKSAIGGSCDGTESADCAQGECFGGICGNTGATCNTNDQCAANNCAVGVCGGAGAMCTNDDGECVALCIVDTCGQASNPGEKCADNSDCVNENCVSDTCGALGASCESNGACAADLACVEAVCAQKSGLGEACDESDDCNVGSCGPDQTCGGVGASCQDNGDCLHDNCNNGTCGANGATCSAGDGSQCVSELCSDGYCCDLPCDQNCFSCAEVDTGAADGTCAQVTAGTDPEGVCGFYWCTNGDCGSNCNTNDDSLCKSEAHCQENAGDDSCEMDVDVGNSCDVDADCVNNANCVDGYCCNSACTADCYSCGIEGHEGTCSPYTGADDGSCTGTTNYCCAGSCVDPNGEYGEACGTGSCTGTWQCAEQSAQCSSEGQACGSCTGDAWSEALCTDGTCTESNAGECAACTECEEAAGGVSCVNVAVLTEDATGDNTCSDPSTCDGNGACLSKAGETCDDGTACASGFCECADATCGGKKCSQDPCSCQFTSDGTSCDGSIDAGSDDAADTCGLSTCDGVGGCQ